MSPARFNGDAQGGRLMHGPRPTPLSIKKESSVFQKQSLPRSSSSQNRMSDRQRPIIIYAHSPKVIHTKPSEFMALVQKLTGASSRSDHDQTAPTEPQNTNNLMAKEAIKVEENSVESSSVVTDEKFGGETVKYTSSLISPTFDAVPNHQFLADIPLFTPNSTSFLFSPSPRPLFRYSDMVSSSPNMTRVASPSVFEAKN